jgi:hypothetical protein
MEAVTLKLKKKHPLNSSLPEYIFRHNQAVRETTEVYRQTMIDIIFSDRPKDRATSEVEMAD